MKNFNVFSKKGSKRWDIFSHVWRKVVTCRLVLDQSIATSTPPPHVVLVSLAYTFFRRQAEFFSNFSILTSDSETREKFRREKSKTQVLPKRFSWPSCTQVFFILICTREGEIDRMKSMQMWWNDDEIVATHRIISSNAIIIEWRNLGLFIGFSI